MAKRQVRLGLAVIVLAAATSVAFADDPPARKPGLWEMTTEGQGVPKTPMRLCLDAAVEALMTEKGKATNKEICSRFEGHLSGSVYTLDSVCKPMDSTQTSHSVTTYVSDVEYRTEIRSKFDPPFMGKTETTMVQTGKWLGPCGADMKPGDMTVNGVKLHVGG